jgi:hypothetical protein
MTETKISIPKINEEMDEEEFEIDIPFSDSL